MVGLYDGGKWTKGGRRFGNRQDKKTPIRQPAIHIISDGITRLPILEGEISQIELPRGNSPLGITLVGGSDTPLRCIVIQEVFPDGFAAQDGRLQPGDQIIEVDGADMTTASHQQVCEALKKSPPVLKLGIYRERIETYKASPSSSVSSPKSSYGEYYDEIFNITIKREEGRPLGIKLGSRRSERGIYIIELMGGSTALLDGRLKPQDRLLVINGEDVRHAKLDRASQLIDQMRDCVSLIASRAPTNHSRERLNSLSQDSLFGMDESEHMFAFSGSSSASDQTSECSAIEEEAVPTYDPISDPDRYHISPGVSFSPHDRDPSKMHCSPDSFGSLENDISEVPPYFCDPQMGISWKSGSRRGSKSCHSSKDSPREVISVGKASNSEGLSQVFGMKTRETRPPLQKKQVNLVKSSGEGLGMRIGGGVNSNEGDTPIYVANINSNGPAGKSRHVKKGDVVLSVDGQSLFGLTHSQAVALLKSTAELQSVSLNLLQGPETSAGANNFVPSWLYWQHLPRSLHISKSVVLYRAEGTSLGFSIVGGYDPNRGPEPIHVLFVVATSPAAVDGRLRCGDRILAVDGHPLESVSHSLAVNLLKHAGTRVHLEVVSWLGTEL